MTQETETDNELRIPGAVDIVSKINDNDRASAIDDINDGACVRYHEFISKAEK